MLLFVQKLQGVGLQPGFGIQFILGFEVEVELLIQLKNENEVEYE